jgi:hypothetical protein
MSLSLMRSEFSRSPFGKSLHFSESKTCSLQTPFAVIKMPRVRSPMALNMLPPTDRSKLITDAQSVFADLCSLKLGRMQHPPRDEVDYLSSLIENGVTMLNAAWEPVLNRAGVAITTRGVFCHQSPMVTITDHAPAKMPTLRCELGDLLIVQSHKRNSRKTYWRAVLVQLKKDAGGKQAAQNPQFWLYDAWPHFRIHAPGFDKQRRNFDRDTRSGRYGLVSNTSWMFCPPAQPLDPSSSSNIDAATFLVEMMYSVDPAQLGRSTDCGRRVFTRPDESNGLNWSQTVWELLNITGANQFTYKRLYDRPLSRVAMYVSSAPNELSSTGSPFDPIPSRSIDERPARFAVLYIDTDSSEARLMAR